MHPVANKPSVGGLICAFGHILDSFPVERPSQCLVEHSVVSEEAPYRLYARASGSISKITIMAHTADLFCWVMQSQALV